MAMLRPSGWQKKSSPLFRQVVEIVDRQPDAVNDAGAANIEQGMLLVRANEDIRSAFCAFVRDATLPFFGLPELPFSSISCRSPYLFPA